MHGGEELTRHLDRVGASARSSKIFRSHRVISSTPPHPCAPIDVTDVTEVGGRVSRSYIMQCTPRATKCCAFGEMWREIMVQAPASVPDRFVRKSARASPCLSPRLSALSFASRGESRRVTAADAWPASSKGQLMAARSAARPPWRPQLPAAASFRRPALAGTALARRNTGGSRASRFGAPHVMRECARRHTLQVPHSSSRLIPSFYLLKVHAIALFHRTL